MLLPVLRSCKGTLMTVIFATLYLGSSVNPVAFKYVGAEETYRTQFDSRVTSNNGKLDSGKKEMDTLVKRSKLPKVGDCWKEALETLRVSCAELDDDLQSRLALYFTSCFNEMMGSPNHICDRSTPVKTCLGALDPAEKDIFRDYFLHTQDMCYYIQSDLWQQETDRAVNDLQFAATEMSRSVMEQKTIADSILESQQTSHSVQKEMIKENYELFEKVINMKTSLEEFGTHAQEQQVIFLEIFEKLRKMQELVIWIQGEMSLIDLITFYAGSVLFAYFVTTSERTHNARVWMIVNIALSLFLERYIYGILSEEGDMSPDEILMWIAYFRRVMTAVTVGIFLIHLAKYRDYDAINNVLLTDMGKRMDAMMEYWEEHLKHLPQAQQQILAGPLNVVQVHPVSLQHNQVYNIADSDATTVIDGSDVDGMTSDSESSTQDDEETPSTSNSQNVTAVGQNQAGGSAQGATTKGIHQLHPAENGLKNGYFNEHESEDSSADENEQEQPTSFIQNLQKKIGLNKTATVLDYNALPEEGATSSKSEAAESWKYSLRDRTTLLSPTKFTEPPPEGRKGKAKVKKGKSKQRATACYFSSDDEI